MNSHVFQHPTGDSFVCADHQVQVWRINLEPSADQVAKFEQLLSADERERAGRFYKNLDRQRFIVGRGLLRTLLARYLNSPPRKICFAYGAHGKPALKEALTFNLSHSGNLALLGLARNGEVGIDLEAVNTDLDVEAVAKQYFTPKEYAEVCAAPADQRHLLFYRYWTLKEAYLKALGIGLAARLDDPVILGAQENLRWQSHQLVLPGYMAWLVTQGGDKEICCWQLPEDFS